MKNIRRCFWGVIVLLVMISACRSMPICDKQHDQLITMLEGLTKKAQNALDEGYLKKGEKEALEYIKSLNQGAYIWFGQNDYQIKLTDVAGHAVVLICKDGIAIFEDTDCVVNGEPDKDHTEEGAKPCIFTLTEEEVWKICNQ